MKQKIYKNLNIFFTASSSDLEKKKKLYVKVIDSIESLGAKITYNWIEDEKKLEPSEIFEKSSKGIKCADVVVAEITYPSIGVGQQIELALNWKIPVIMIHQLNNFQISRFAIGKKSSYIQNKEYSFKNIKDILNESFDSIISEKFEKFNFISTKEINNYIGIVSSNQNISKSQYLRKIIREWMIKNPI